MEENYPLAGYSLGIKAGAASLPPRGYPFIFGTNKSRAILLVAAAAYLYLNLFRLPHTPFLLGGDQISFWLRGLRLLDHEQVYRDFYQFTPPGADLVYAGLFRVFGAHVWVTNAFVLILGVGLCGVCVSIASRIMRRGLAVLVTAVFLVCIYCKLLNGTHHWLSVACVMAAVWWPMRNRNGWSGLIVGGLLGCASFFTQTRGVVALLAVVLFLAWKQLRIRRAWVSVLKDSGVLAAGFVSAWLLLSAYFIETVGLKRLWYFQVTHVQHHIVNAEGGHALGLPDALTLHNLPRLTPYLLVYLLLTLIYPVTLWRIWRDREIPAVTWERVSLLTIVGFFLLVEVAFSPNWLRLYAVSMPGFILLGWHLTRIRKLPRLAMAVLWAGLGCVAGWQTVSRSAHQRVVAALPGGTVATYPETYLKLHWLTGRTKPGEFLFQAAWPGVYLPLQLRNPSYLETVAPFDGPPPGAVANVPSELESHHVQYVIWSTSLDAALSTPDDDLAMLRHYLNDCYERVQVFADGDAVWQHDEHRGCSASWQDPVSQAGGR